MFHCDLHSKFLPAINIINSDVSLHEKFGNLKKLATFSNEFDHITIIDGPINCGKSTMLATLQKNGLTIFDEPEFEWCGITVDSKTMLHFYANEMNKLLKNLPLCEQTIEKLRWIRVLLTLSRYLFWPKHRTSLYTTIPPTKSYFPYTKPLVMVRDFVADQLFCDYLSEKIYDKQWDLFFKDLFFDLPDTRILYLVEFDDPTRVLCKYKKSLNEFYKPRGQVIFPALVKKNLTGAKHNTTFAACSAYNRWLIDFTLPDLKFSKPITIINGNISAGKSTHCRAVGGVPEPEFNDMLIDGIGALNYFYKNWNVVTFHIQSTLLRFFQINLYPKSENLTVERSPFSALLFIDVVLESKNSTNEIIDGWGDVNTLKKLLENFDQELVQTNLFIHTPAEECFSRRQTNGLSFIELDYLKMVEKKHLDYEKTKGWKRIVGDRLPRD